MIIVVILLALAFLAVLAVVLLRRAGGGRFPWLQFYMKGRESGFIFREINLLRRVSIETKLENPTALFWSIKMLDRALKGTIIKYRARSQEQDPEYNLLLSKLFELRKRVEFDQPKYKLGIKSSRKLLPKQGLRIMLPGLGPFGSIVVENLTRYMAVSHPQGPKLPDGFSWKNQKVGIYFWRAEDARLLLPDEGAGGFHRPQVPDPPRRPFGQPHPHAEAQLPAGGDGHRRRAVPAEIHRPGKRGSRGGARACAAAWPTSRREARRSSSAARPGSASPSRSSSPSGTRWWSCPAW